MAEETATMIPSEETTTTENVEETATNSEETSSESIQDNQNEETPDKNIGEKDFKLTVPDGGLVSQDDADRIVSYAKEQGLSVEVAQEILNREHIAAESVQKATIEQVEALGQQWINEARADKDFGGAKYTENINIAKAGFDQFGSTKLGELLQQTKLGNHVEVLKLFQKLGELVKSDSFVLGTNAQTQTKSAEELFYGKTEQGDN